MKDDFVSMVIVPFVCVVNLVLSLVIIANITVFSCSIEWNIRWTMVVPALTGEYWQPDGMYNLTWQYVE